METKENIEELKENINNNCNCGNDCKCAEQTEDHKCHCGEQSDDNKCHCGEHKKEHKDHAKKYKEEIARLEEENKSLNEKIKLSQAELINYRKRKDEETASILKFSNQDLIKEILPVLDNFERALNVKNLSEEVQKYQSGFSMMHQTLLTVLNKYGVEVINPLGEEFDPNTSEALMIDKCDDKEEDIVTEVLQKGYKLKDRVIRPASVKINKK